MLSEELVRVHEGAQIVPRFSERYPGLSAADGYAAARALHEHRLAQGWRRVGRKIGFTNRTLWARYGVHEPMWGTVYDRTLIQAVGHRATVPLEGLAQPRIEPEIAFKLKRAPRSAEELPDCLEWMAHAVEIVQCHHPDWKVSIADCTADNGLHGRLILGAPQPIRDLDKLPSVEARLFKGERQVDRGVGANVLGSPLLALGFLVRLLGEELGAGEVVSTGVLTDAHSVAPGETWRTEVDGFPGLTLQFR